MTDFSGSGSYPLVDQGMHQVTVTGMQIKESPNTGNEYYEFEFTVANGEFSGQKLWLRNMLNAKDRNRYLRETLEGISGKEIPLEEVPIESFDYVGRGCLVQVVHDEYQGQVRAQVAGVHPVDADFSGPPIGDEPYSDVPHPADDKEPW